MTTIQQIAEAFSTHRFRDVYDYLHPQVQWIVVGQARLEGRDQVIEACEASLSQLARQTTQILRFKAVAGPEIVAVDAITRYVDVKWQSSIVSSCDFYEFVQGAVTSVTSYMVEITPADLAGR